MPGTVLEQEQTEVAGLEVATRKQVRIFNVRGSVHRKNTLIYIQQDATLHSLFYLEIALHVSGGTTTHHQKRIQLYLQRLISVNSSTIATGSSNGD
jgi:hypothetical protein